MARLREAYLTPEEYLAIERAAEFKSEYVDGVMYAMAGGSERHNIIVANLIISIGSQLRDRPCRVYPSDLKISVPNSPRYFYPDVSVVCGETRYADEHKDVVLNPMLIIEVLSEATAGFDRGKKFLSYQQIDSLTTYLLVDQDEVLVERYERHENGAWVYTLSDNIDGSIILPSIQCETLMRDIYNKVI